MFSILEMFTIGVGPSSSHTVGPMVAASRFAASLERDGILNRVGRVRTVLYGSLALTGLGHGTDRATVAGLEGNVPKTVDTDHMSNIRMECEAGGESYTGMVAVGAVVVNRVNSGSFPNSVSGVIYQGGQFTPVATGTFQSVLSRGARSDCYAAAQAALAGESPVGGCLYFNSGYGSGIQIGYQHFY